MTNKRYRGACCVRITTSLLPILAALALPAQLQATDKSGNYAIWGQGQQSCYRYLKAREASADAAFKSYVMGYLTAFNALTPETYSISRDMNLDEIMAWLDDYCDSSKMSGLEQSLLEFVSQHHEDRYRQPPGRVGR